MKYTLFYYLVFGMLLTSCEFDPNPIQDQTTEELWSNAAYGEGILTNAYTHLNTSYPVYMDYLTDNAVPSAVGANQIALGGWTVENSPLGDWTNCYNMIKYLNLYIKNGKNLLYSVSDKVKNDILRKHRMGEAYYLRAWYQSQLLQVYAGKPKTGTQMLGFPIVTKVLEIGDDLDLPRNTYEECAIQIAKDCDSASAVLPVMYNQGTDSYYGLSNRGRASGLGAKALKARVFLNAASPAYGDSSPALWERAAKAAYEAIQLSGGLVNLAPYNNFNDAASFDNIWIQPSYSGTGMEYVHYPPSLYGLGECNPSQNLVNEFPAKNGYPIDNSNSNYDPLKPYENRDARLTNFIFYNGDSYNDTTIKTFVGGDDAPGGLSQRGTRTGYYMKKLLSKKVKLNPGNQSNDIKFYVYLSKTELYLNFAEAANEAYGPDNAILGYSASDVMRKIRMRAGIDSNPASSTYEDKYLESQVTAGKVAFRNFIQSNRRLELCFEGFRFWDIRRWNMPLNHTVQGVVINTSNSGYTYSYVPVENHTFQSYMQYAPLPYTQTLIMNNLKQNAEW